MPPSDQPCNAEKIVALLREDTRRALCDDCIAELTGIPNRHAVAQSTNPLGLTRDFRREDAACHRCKKVKLTTQALTA